MGPNASLQVVDGLSSKFSSSGWFEPQFAEANHPLLEILFEIQKIRNKSRYPSEHNGSEVRLRPSEATLMPPSAEHNGTEVRRQPCKTVHTLKFRPKLKGVVLLHFRVLRQLLFKTIRKNKLQTHSSTSSIASLKFA